MATEKEVSVQINGMWIRRCRLMVSRYNGFDLLARRRFNSGTLIAYKSKKFFTEEEKNTIFGKSPVYDLTIQWDEARDCPVSSNAVVTPKAAPAAADDFEPSEYQKAILNTVLTATDHIEIKAYAGSGKTATLVWLVNQLVKLFLLPRNVIFLAFNKNMEEELSGRLVGTGCPAMTTHAFGFRALKAVYGNNLQLDNRRNNEMFLQLLCDKSGFDYSEHSFKQARKLDSYKLRSAVMELASHCKNAAVIPQLVDNIWQFGISDTARAMELFEHYEVEIPSDLETLKPLCTPAELVEMSLQTICKSIPLPGEKLSVLAFDDMLYIPVVLNVSFGHYDLVLCDESQDFNMCQIKILEKLANS